MASKYILKQRWFSHVSKNMYGRVMAYTTWKTIAQANTLEEIKIVRSDIRHKPGLHQEAIFFQGKRIDV